MWVLRNFQFNNKRKYEAVYFTDQSVISTDELFIPNNVRVVDKVTKSTLILINKVKLGIFLKHFFHLQNLRIIDKFFSYIPASTRMRLWFHTL